MIPTFRQRFSDTLQLIKAKLLGACKSLTVWFNGLMAGAIPALQYLSDSYDSVRSSLPGHTGMYLLYGMIAANVLLRFRTKKPLEDK